MIRRAVSATIALCVLVAFCPPALAYEYRDNQGVGGKHWVTNPIIITFSSSLTSPPRNIKSGSDVIGAARRALDHWSRVANIKFLENNSATQTISPQNVGDGINLITVATDNAAAFGSSDSPGRTRVFYDSAGTIVEADVALNPNEPFSTDGTPGTYDLESTFTHEVGHLLGLEHSVVIGATMQPRQAKNGLFNLPAISQRTLSEDDRAGLRALYAPEVSGSISGKLLINAAAINPQFNGTRAFVVAEDAATGKVIAGNIANTSGGYRLEGLAPGSYRLLGETLSGPITAADMAQSTELNVAAISIRGANGQTAEQISTVKVAGTGGNSADFPVSLNISPALQPKVIGLNSELSTVALPVEAGKTSRILIGGDGVDQISASGISVESPFFKIDPGSLSLQHFDTPYPVISFDVAVTPNAQAGDYSIRLQLPDGEMSYLPGALTIDPGANTSDSANAVDDPEFFVRQHYRDFLGREPDLTGLEYWTSQLRSCGNDAECSAKERLAISAAFFVESEFQQTGGFVYRVYKAGLARPPAFSEFNRDRGEIVAGGSLESSRQSFALDFVQRPAFVEKYPSTLSSEEFMNRLLSLVRESSGLDLSRQRASLLALWDGTDTGRAAIVRQLAENPEFIQTEYKRAFVLMQYFGYLRRDADRGGYDFWLNLLDSKRPNDAKSYRAMVCAFLTSTEYQLRFGITPTHTNAECAR